MTVSIRIIETARSNGKGTLYGWVAGGSEIVNYRNKTASNPAFNHFSGNEWFGPNCLDRNDAIQKGNWIKHVFAVNPDYMPTAEDQRKHLTTFNILDVPKYKRQHERFLDAIEAEDKPALLKAMIRDLRKTLQEMAYKL